MLRHTLLLSIACIGLPLAGQTETLQGALEQAFLTNPQLEAQRSLLGSAQEQLKQARGQRAPTVDLSGSAGYESLDSNRPTNIFSGSATGDRAISSAQVQASLPLYTGGRIAAGIEQAKAGIAAADAQLDGAGQDLILQVVTAYVDVLRDQETINIRENSVALLQEQFRAATDRFDVGFATRTDVKQAEARLQGAQASLAAASAQLEASLAVYALLVGLEAQDLVAAPPAPMVPASFEDALNVALTENPDILALREAERSAEQGVRAARGALRPSLSLVGTAGIQENWDDNLEDTSVTALAQATVPLFQGGILRSQVRSAQLQMDQARLQTVNAERQIRASVAQSWYSNIAAKRAIEASELQVQAAEIAFEGAQEELNVGTRTTLDVLDQEQQLLDARLGLINSQRAAYVATYQLLRAMGQLSLGITTG